MLRLNDFSPGTVVLGVCFGLDFVPIVVTLTQLNISLKLQRRLID